MDARKILVKRLAVSLVVGLFLAICLCAALDKGVIGGAAGIPALAGDEEYYFPISDTLLYSVCFSPIEGTDLGFHAAWEAELPGDYDRDGKVSIADITPIAMHFGEEVGDNLYLTMLDDSQNGVIDAGDLNHVERYYGICVVGFELALKNSETLEWRLDRTVYWSWRLVPVVVRCKFEADIQARQGEQRFRIRPIYYPLSIEYGIPNFDDYERSLLPYLQPSSQ